MKIKIPTSTKDLKTAAKEVGKGYTKVLDPFNITGVQGIFDKQKAPDYSGYEAEQAAAIAAQQQAYQDFIAGGAPVYSQGDKIAYEELDPTQLAKLGPSAYDNITTDPNLANAELDALRSLEERSKEGLTLQDEADMAKLRSDVARQNKGRMGAIQQGMQARGLSGSGLDLVAQMQANQDATDMEAYAALEKAAQAQNNKRQAAVDAGNMASQQRNQQFQEAAQKAAAKDEINRFNTANTVNAQVANNQGRNNANAANWNRANQTSDNNTNASYTYRKDQLSAQNQNAQNAYNWSADKQNRAMMQDQQKQDAKAGQMGALFGVAGGAAGAFFGGPAGAAAGYQVGNSLGQSVGRRNYAYGGMVSGVERSPFDDPANDIVPAWLSPGEVVVPKTVAKDPAAAASFVAQENAKFEPTIDNAKAKGRMNPYSQFVADERTRMEAADKDIANARKMQDYGSYGNIIGKMLNDYNNSQKKDIILKNKMGDLGATPRVSQASRPQYDGSMIDKLGQQGVDRAVAARDQGAKDAQYKHQLGDYERMNDPNSEESIQAREYLKSIVPGAEKMAGFDGLSAAKVDKISGGLFDKYKIDVTEKNANARLQKQIAAEDARTKRSDEKQDKDLTFKLSKAYQDDDVTKRTTEIRQARKSAEALAASPSPTNDIALVFAYMRANDPRSTVREGEYAMAAQSGGLPQRVQAAFEQAKNGQLTDKARADMLKSIQTNSDAQEKSQVERDGYYRDQADYYGVRPDIVLGKSTNTAVDKNRGESKLTHGSNLP